MVKPHALVVSEPEAPPADPAPPCGPIRRWTGHQAQPTLWRALPPRRTGDSTN